jgi:hypothetical protein
MADLLDSNTSDLECLTLDLRDEDDFAQFHIREGEITQPVWQLAPSVRSVIKTWLFDTISPHNMQP